MTCEEYMESVRFVKEATERFHTRTGKHPTSQEAVKALRMSLVTKFFPPMAHWRNERMIEKRVCQRTAVRDLIRRMLENPEKDPISIAYGYLGSMDDIVTNSENTIVTNFYATMETAIDTIIKEVLS